MRSEAEANQAVEQYADMVRRICFVHLKNHHDTEDIFQEVFLKYILWEGAFENGEHEKAWLARVTINACKDWLRRLGRRRTVSLDELNEEVGAIEDEPRELLEEVLALPEKYRDVIYLFYYENNTAVEIAEILGKSENTVYTWLARARERLKKRLGGDLA